MVFAIIKINFYECLKIMNKKKFLVGVLSAGETEYEDCIAALKKQDLKDWDLFEIKNQTKKVAHDTLYSHFMREAAHYEYFLKLDADMVFSNENVLQTIYDLCYQENLAHLMSYVFDCPSQLAIPGVQIYRADCVWEGSTDLLNTDYSPKVFGKSKVLMDERWIEHMPHSSDYQMFRYGIHKGLKSLQPDRSNKSIPKFLMHLNILQGIARNARLNPETNIFYAVIGAYLFAEGVYKAIEHHTDEAKRLFEKLSTHPEILSDYRNRSLHYWRHDVQSAYKWYALLNKGNKE